MKTQGYCIECNRIKWVNVLPHRLWTIGIRGWVEGTCDECVEKKTLVKR